MCVFVYTASLEIKQYRCDPYENRFLLDNSVVQYLTICTNVCHCDGFYQLLTLETKLLKITTALPLVYVST